MTGLELLALQIAALKSQIGSMQAQVLAMESAVENMQANETAAGSCPHSETENHSTFSYPDLRCKACGEQVLA